MTDRCNWASRQSKVVSLAVIRSLSLYLWCSHSSMNNRIFEQTFLVAFTLLVNICLTISWNITQNIISYNDDMLGNIYHSDSHWMAEPWLLSHWWRGGLTPDRRDSGMELGAAALEEQPLTGACCTGSNIWNLDKYLAECCWGAVENKRTKRTEAFMKLWLTME